jgi:hypothetical protein
MSGEEGTSGRFARKDFRTGAPTTKTRLRGGDPLQALSGHWHSIAAAQSRAMAEGHNNKEYRK